MLSHNLRRSKLLFISCTVTFGLLLFLWLIRPFESEVMSSSTSLPDLHKIPSKGREDAQEPITEATRAFSSNQHRPDSSPGQSEALGLFGLDPDIYESLDVAYVDAEIASPSDGGAAWTAASIRKHCDFLTGADINERTPTPPSLRVILKQCADIAESAMYQTWELIEFGARNNSIPAIVAQPSYPPPWPSRHDNDSALSAAEWNSMVAKRIRKAADQGYPNALLKAAEIYTSGFAGETDYDLAERYLEYLFQIPNLTEYQNALGTSLLMKLRERTP